MNALNCSLDTRLFLCLDGFISFHQVGQKFTKHLVTCSKLQTSHLRPYMLISSEAAWKFKILKLISTLCNLRTREWDMNAFQAAGRCRTHLKSIRFIIIRLTNNPFKCFITITYSFDLSIIYLLKFAFSRQNTWCVCDICGICECAIFTVYFFFLQCKTH